MNTEELPWATGEPGFRVPCSLNLVAYVGGTVSLLAAVAVCAATFGSGAVSFDWVMVLLVPAALLLPWTIVIALSRYSRGSWGGTVLFEGAAWWTIVVCGALLVAGFIMATKTMASSPQWYQLTYHPNSHTFTALDGSRVVQLTSTQYDKAVNLQARPFACGAVIFLAVAVIATSGELRRCRSST